MTLPSRHNSISVVMPVHNALPYLDEAVGSILAQSHRDFEFVIQDDGSTDGSAEQLAVWATRDSRIRLFHSERNLGPSASSNAVVAQAKGELIARMDADDISHPDRLRRQIELLDAHPEIGLVGSLCNIIDGDGRTIRGPDYCRLRRTSWFAPFTHGSIMYRREHFDRVGGYREPCEYWVDQDFVLRISAQTRVVTIPLPLYKHRQSRVSTRLASDSDRVERAVDLMYRSMGQLNRGRSYEELLRTRPTAGKIDPRVFISLGSLVLWAGGKPRLFRRMLARADLRFNFSTASALVWTAWASLGPASLRAFMGVLARLRNMVASKQGSTETAVDWPLPRPLPAISPPQDSPR